MFVDVLNGGGGQTYILFTNGYELTGLTSTAIAGAYNAFAGQYGINLLPEDGFAITGISTYDCTNNFSNSAC
jgi:hypothetical protein